MAKANAGKPGSGKKAGGELPYASAEKCLGGSVNGEPKAGLNPDFKFSGDKAPTAPKGSGSKKADAKVH